MLFRSWAGAVIALEIGASLLVLTGCFRWLGALALAGFTLLASLLADRFWAAPPGTRRAVRNTFFEHWGLVGGLLLVALLAFLFVVRPLMQKVTGSQLAVASVGAQAMPELPSSPRPMTVAELQALEEARLIEGEQVKLSESVRAKALLKRTTEAAQQQPQHLAKVIQDRKSTRLNSSHTDISRMPSSA